MAPVSLSQLENQLFISPDNQDSTSLSSSAFFNNALDQRQTIEIRELRDNEHEVDKMMLHDGSSSNHQVCNSSFNSPQPVMDDPSRARDHNLSLFKMEDQEEESKSGHGSAKWTSSKMRLMRRMMRSSSGSSSPTTDKSINSTTPRVQNQDVQEYRHSQRRSPSNNTKSTTTRVCLDCNTSSTPLWRSGPMGPKSLCNACGIRQRKAARRAMEEAASSLATCTDASSSTTTRVHNNKEKKSRTSHFEGSKNKGKSTATTGAEGKSQGEKKLDFKDFASSLRSDSAFDQQVFPHDEVAEAALLLMHLSCGAFQV